LLISAWIVVDTSRGDGRGLPVTELRRGRFTSEDTSKCKYNTKTWNKVSVMYLISFYTLISRDALLASLLNSALEYVINKIQVY
jgi:hypothetical protein